MIACVTSFAASLLYLAPVIVMIGFVLYVKIRNRGVDPDELEPAQYEAYEARELEPII
jgi:hypothetical protein